MTIPELPKDLVEEILSFVPATSLKRLRPTCKRWNRLIKYDGRFARKNSDKAIKQFVALVLTDDCMIFPLRVNLHGINPSVEVKSALFPKDPYSKYSAQFHISRVIHCDGLLLCLHRDESRMVLWNPLTGESRAINITKKCSCYSLGYYREDNKSCNKSYKILSFYRFSNDFKIYEFESDSWRALNDINASGGWELGDSFDSASLKGKVYMFAYDETEHRSLSLLKFDFSTEKSVLVPLPYRCHSFENTSLSVVREEKLSVSLQRDKNSKIEIWVTNKIGETTNVVSWSKVLALDMNPEFILSQGVSFLLDEEKKVAIFFDWLISDEIEDKIKHILYIGTGEDNKLTRVDAGLGSYDEICPAILDYVPSLVQIEQEPGKRKRESIIDIKKKLITLEAKIKILDSQKTQISIAMSLVKKAKKNMVGLLGELVASLADDENTI